jgi:hypothetical protein
VEADAGPFRPALAGKHVVAQGALLFSAIDEPFETWAAVVIESDNFTVKDRGSLERSQASAIDGKRFVKSFWFRL